MISSSAQPVRTEWSPTDAPEVGILGSRSAKLTFTLVWAWIFGQIMTEYELIAVAVLMIALRYASLSYLKEDE